MKAVEYKKIAKIANKYNFDLFNVMTNYGLFSGSNNLFKTIKIIEIVNKISNVKGDIIEFGVWNGNTSLLIKKVIDILQIKKKIYLFDHFMGLNHISSKDKEKFRGMYRGSLPLIKDLIKFFKFKKIEIIEDDAINLDSNYFSGKKFSLVIVDVDLYEPTQKILDSVHKSLSKNGLIIFDEANKDDFPGEKQAMKEFFKKHNKNYKKKILSKLQQPDVMLQKICN